MKNFGNSIYPLCSGPKLKLQYCIIRSNAGGISSVLSNLMYLLHMQPHTTYIIPGDKHAHHQLRCGQVRGQQHTGSNSSCDRISQPCIVCVFYVGVRPPIQPTISPVPIARRTHDVWNAIRPRECRTRVADACRCHAHPARDKMPRAPLPVNQLSSSRGQYGHTRNTTTTAPATAKLSRVRGSQADTARELRGLVEVPRYSRWIYGDRARLRVARCAAAILVFVFASLTS